MPALVSSATGTLLGAAFLGMLPAALAQATTRAVTSAVLLGMVAFFLLEKLVLWRHCHEDDCPNHGRGRALWLDTVSSLATMPGAIAAYLWLGAVREAVPYILAVSAASFIYIATADLIPGLHRQVTARATLQQMALLLLGVCTIAFFRLGE